MSSWFSGTSQVGGDRHQDSRSHSHGHSTSHRRASSPTTTHRRASSPQTKGYFVRSHSPAASTTSRGFWSRPHQSSTSKYSRRPRGGFIARTIHKLKQYLQDLLSYAKKNPVKFLMVVVMPLVTGGALHSVLKTMGIRLPAGFGGSSSGMGSGYGGRGSGEGAGGFNIGQVLSIAKMFM